MKCKTCGRELHTDMVFCPGCATPLRSGKALFLAVRSNAQKFVQHHVESQIGKNGASRIARAAWFIASAKPQDAGVLSGESEDWLAACDCVHRVTHNANTIADQIIEIYRAYNE